MGGVCFLFECDVENDADKGYKMQAQELSLTYRGNNAPSLKSVNLDIQERAVTAFIGAPVAVGTFLRCLNRMNDFIQGVKINGSVFGSRGYLRFGDGCH